MHAEWLGGPWFSGEGLNPGPLWWKLGIFTLDPQGSLAACSQCSALRGLCHRPAAGWRLQLGSLARLVAEHRGVASCLSYNQDPRQSVVQIPRARRNSLPSLLFGLITC